MNRLKEAVQSNNTEAVKKLAAGLVAVRLVRNTYSAVLKEWLRRTIGESPGA